MSNSPNTLTGSELVTLPKDTRLDVAIILTEWNAEVCSELLKGALEVLALHQIRHKIITVPGCVEIPFAIAHDDRTTNHNPLYRAYIAFGCVIKGETPHFEYVCQSVTNGITQLNLTQQSPVIFGVLTVLNQQQANDRLGGAHGHKGKEAAITALKMLSMMHHRN
jgi:6,7-dimethyl-8-ribityllumazine synthase